MSLSSPDPRSAAAGTDPRRDPAMRSLFQMSRTAGVGLQDYAAVNVAAVVGVLLAVASVLVLIFSDVAPLLVLPAIAIAFSVIAIAQIHRSSGTQTGQLLAIAGLVIAGSIAGVNIAGRLSIASKQRHDTAAIAEQLHKFQIAAVEGKAADAYALFDSRFQENVKFETFERTLAAQLQRVFVGAKVTSFELGDRVVFETDANGGNHATALLFINGDGKTPDGFPFRAGEPAEFTFVNGAWKFHTIINWFVTTKSATDPAGASPASGGGAPSVAPRAPVSPGPQ